VQNDFYAKGELVDFSSEGFRVSINSETMKHNNWFNPDILASVRLISDNRTVYSEYCTCIRQQEQPDFPKEFVFSSKKDSITRFQKKKFGIHDATYRQHSPLHSTIHFLLEKFIKIFSMFQQPVSHLF
jgi:hypothetical protein